MPAFGPASMARLQGVHPDLRRLCEEVIKDFDFSVVQGHRDQVEQDEAYEKGLSQLRWPHSAHNATPARAVDLVASPIDWADTRRALFFAGFVMGTAARLGIKVRWGGDWNGDTEVGDNKFNDLDHFELVG